MICCERRLATAEAATAPRPEVPKKLSQETSSIRGIEHFAHLLSRRCPLPRARGAKSASFAAPSAFNQLLGIRSRRSRTCAVCVPCCCVQAMFFLKCRHRKHASMLARKCQAWRWSMIELSWPDKRLVLVHVRVCHTSRIQSYENADSAISGPLPSRRRAVPVQPRLLLHQRPVPMSAVPGWLDFGPGVGKLCLCRALNLCDDLDSRFRDFDSYWCHPVSIDWAALRLHVSARHRWRRLGVTEIQAAPPGTSLEVTSFVCSSAACRRVRTSSCSLRIRRFASCPLSHAFVSLIHSAQSQC